jgi:hypothetical protein
MKFQGDLGPFSSAKHCFYLQVLPSNSSDYFFGLQRLFPQAVPTPESGIRAFTRSERGGRESKEEEEAVEDVDGFPITERHRAPSASIAICQRCQGDMIMTMTNMIVHINVDDDMVARM